MNGDAVHYFNCVAPLAASWSCTGPCPDVAPPPTQSCNAIQFHVPAHTACRQRKSLLVPSAIVSWHHLKLVLPTRPGLLDRTLSMDPCRPLPKRSLPVNYRLHTTCSTDACATCTAQYELLPAFDMSILLCTKHGAQDPHNDSHQVMREAVERGDGEAERDFSAVIQDLHSQPRRDNASGVRCKILWWLGK
jgi:hypothetical protein